MAGGKLNVAALSLISFTVHCGFDPVPDRGGSTKNERVRSQNAQRSVHATPT